MHISFGDFGHMSVEITWLWKGRSTQAVCGFILFCFCFCCFLFVLFLVVHVDQTRYTAFFCVVKEGHDFQTPQNQSQVFSVSD